MEPQGNEDLFPSWEGDGEDVPHEVSGNVDEEKEKNASAGAIDGDGHEVFDNRLLSLFKYVDTAKQQLYGHTYCKSMDQPGKVANPARSQLNEEN